jgi:hypothetical protein
MTPFLIAGGNPDWTPREPQLMPPPDAPKQPDRRCVICGAPVRSVRKGCTTCSISCGMRRHWRNNGSEMTAVMARRTRRFPFRGESLTVDEIHVRSGVSRKTIWTRIYRGWSADEAAAMPTRRVGRGVGRDAGSMFGGGR